MGHACLLRGVSSAYVFGGLRLLGNCLVRFCRSLELERSVISGRDIRILRVQ